MGNLAAKFINICRGTEFDEAGTAASWDTNPMIWWPESIFDGLATDATIRSPSSYGVPPSPSGFRIADLHCAPAGCRRSFDGIYSEFGMAVVISGAFEYLSEGDARIAVPGTLVFANKNEAFTCNHLCTDGNRRIALFFSDELIVAIAEDLNLIEPRFPVTVEPPSHLTPFISGLLFRMAQQHPDNEESAVAIAGATLQCASGRPSREKISPVDRSRVLDVIRYIDANFTTACSLDTLASIAGVSRYRFARQFRAVTGETANQYVVNRRLSTAAIRLTSTTCPISEIAYDVGFNDLSYFNARFKATFGCTPKVWRRT